MYNVQYTAGLVCALSLCQYLVLHGALVACHPLCAAPPCWVVGRPMNKVFVRGANPRTGSLCSTPISSLPRPPCICWAKAQLWTFNPFSFEQQQRSLLSLKRAGKNKRAGAYRAKKVMLPITNVCLWVEGIWGHQNGPCLKVRRRYRIKGKSNAHVCVNLNNECLCGRMQTEG